ncbi:MAG TPA: YihY/virulence factor BrkB family protein [Geminicoccaceae bacterium]|nr:YihY/virulence factor BrkB family protein [Geminicoccaceae bacterium]
MNDRAGAPLGTEEQSRASDLLRWAARRLYLGLRNLWQAIMHLIDDGGMTYAGHIAFMTLFSMFPFLIFLTTLAGELGQTDEVREFVTLALGMLPPEVGGAIRPAIEEVISNRRTGLMTVSILASLWAVSSGIEALREALNKAYGVEEPRSIWFCRLQSLLFTIVASIGIIIVMLVLVIGPVVWSYVQPLFEEPWQWGWMYETLRYLLAISLLYLVVALLYRWLPSRHLPRREILPGAAVTVVLWLALASLFSFYLQNLARFSVTYGSLGGIVITLMFFYVSALIFIFGAELNSARRRAEAARLRAERAHRHEAAAG